MNPRPALALVLTGLLSAPAATAVAAPADEMASRAAPTGNVTMTNWVRTSNACVDQPLSYSLAGLDDPKWGDTWSLRINTRNLNGSDTPSDYFSSSRYQPRPKAGTATFSLCGWRDSPGTYEVAPLLTYTVDNGSALGQDVTVPLPTSTFTISNQTSQATLKLRKKGKKLRVRVSAVVLGIAGAENTPYEDTAVSVRYRYKGMWVSLKGATGTTNNRGEATFTVKRPKAAKKFRLQVAATEYIQGSTARARVR